MKIRIILTDAAIRVTWEIIQDAETQMSQWPAWKREHLALTDWVKRPVESDDCPIDREAIDPALVQSKDKEPQAS